MRRNRRRKTFQFKPANVGMAILLVFAVAPWLAYCVINVSSDQVSAQIHLLEGDIGSQRASLRREEVKWNRLVAQDNLDRAVASHGLRLEYAPPERTVHVAADGRAAMPPSLVRALAQERRERAGEAVARNRR